MSFNLVRSLFSRHAKQSLASRNVPQRGLKEHERGMRRWMFDRRQLQGPEPQRPPSSWLNWNYDMEVCCFGKRLHEEFEGPSLKQALTHPSYAEEERRRRSEVGLKGGDDVAHNQELSILGGQLMDSNLRDFLTNSYPRLPSPAIQCLMDHLTNDRMLSHIAHHLGLHQLILSQESPPSDATVSSCFKAVVAVLHQHQGKERSASLLRDLVGAQMVGERVDEVWVVDDPMALLNEECQQRNLPPPQSRMVWSYGDKSILGTFVVAIFSNQLLIGQSAGESVSEAEAMAARDALRNLYHIQDHHTPLQFSSNI